MATMIGTYDYFLWTNDQSWFSTIYPKYKAAMAFITSKIDSTGMLDVTGTNDWGRLNQGGHNTEANMLMYHTLTTGSQLATWAGDSASSTKWSALAATLKNAVNGHNYDPNVGYVSLHLLSSVLILSGHSKTAIRMAASTPKTPTAWPSSLVPPIPHTYSPYPPS